jgi:hypothetical protein
MRRIAWMVVLSLPIALVAPTGAQAATSKSSFDVFVEETVSASSSGLMLETELEGSFNVVAKTATGEGEYMVMAGSEVVEHGTFELTRLVSFQFYGCGEVTADGDRISLPPDLCGGRALFAFHATGSNGEQRDGLYEVNCQIHNPGGQAPPGTSEGVKANSRGVNFNTHVTGDNLFVMQ